MICTNFSSAADRQVQHLGSLITEPCCCKTGRMWFWHFLAEISNSSKKTMFTWPYMQYKNTKSRKFVYSIANCCRSISSSGTYINPIGTIHFYKLEEILWCIPNISVISPTDSCSVLLKQLHRTCNRGPGKHCVYRFVTCWHFGLLHKVNPKCLHFMN